MANTSERSKETEGELAIVVVGEIKGILDADREFSDEEVGQILDLVQELLIKQGWRKWAYGFLTDGWALSSFVVLGVSMGLINSQDRAYSRKGKG